MAERKKERENEGKRKKEKEREGKRKKEKERSENSDALNAI